MRHIVIYDLSGSTIYFFHISYKRHDLWKKVTEHKMCALIFSTSVVWKVSHSEKKWPRYDKKCTRVFI